MAYAARTAPDAAFRLKTLAAGTDGREIAWQAHFLESTELSSGAVQPARRCAGAEIASTGGSSMRPYGWTSCRKG